MSSRYVRPLRCCALGAVLVWLVACAADPGPPEEEIRRLIDLMEQAAESGSVGQTAQWLHPSYSDTWHPNKAAATRTLFGLLRRHSNVHLYSVVKSIQLSTEENRAHSVVYLAMSAVPVDSVEGLLAIKADLYRFDIGLRLDEDAWQISEAQWQRADPAAALR